MEKDLKFTGRIVVLSADSSELIPDIDTDQIFHNAYLHITDIDEMGKYALGNLEGWKNFPEIAQPGDILVAGDNFGSGSSRQHAVDCFKALGVRLIIAKSFGAIYKRNAINSGMPLMEVPQLDEYLEKGIIRHLQQVKVDMETGTMESTDGKEPVQLAPLSRVQKDILSKGTLLRI